MSWWGSLEVKQSYLQMRHHAIINTMSQTPSKEAVLQITSCYDSLSFAIGLNIEKKCFTMIFLWFSLVSQCLTVFHHCVSPGLSFCQDHLASEVDGDGNEDEVPLSGAVEHHDMYTNIIGHSRNLNRRYHRYIPGLFFRAMYGDIPDMALNAIVYLHFRILKFPLKMGRFENEAYLQHNYISKMLLNCI